MLSRRSFVASSLAASGLICASELPEKPGKTEVLVVGAGASGAAISWRLASLGLNVTCLEQGGYEDYAKSPAADPKWELLRQRDADEARMDALDALAATVAPIVERDPKRVLLDTAASAPLTK